ncbi:MAG TPA: flagellar filament capping protein FliD [Bryobacteraceae bacterium]|nr:flagellar filament capping protein FliD [Bryobacteraceae bacterium]
MGTTSATPTYFTGSSSFSTDFNNVIDRAVAIAQLPITQLTTDQTSLTNQSSELSKLDTTLTALQTAVAQIGTALGGSSYQSEVSSPNVVNVNVADGAQEGYYTMNVSSIGAYESSMSTQNWNMPEVKNQPTAFTLVVGNQNYSVTATDNSAQSVANAINANYGNLVQATTVNVAPGDTRLSLRSTTLGQTNLDLLNIPTGAAPATLQQQATSGYAISQSTASWDDSGGPATYSLTVGGSQYAITPASNSADDVVGAINATAGGQVRASVVDLGTGSSHDYRISLQSTTDGPMNGSSTLDLKRTGGTSLQTQQIPARSRSTTSWNAAPDSDGSRSTYNLVIGTSKYAFTPADNSAGSVASAINSVYGSLVHASVVDMGTSGSPDYRISLQGPAGSTYDIQKTTAADYLKEQTAGSLASYEINNSGVTNTSSTRNITISSGVTATLVGTSGGTPAGSDAVGITVTRSTDALNTALAGFATAYNAVVTELETQRGQSGGALQGQSIVNQLSSMLASISTYSAGGQFNVLEDLGLKLELNGQITYNPLTLIAADLTSSPGVSTFLGSATGGGFLKKATDVLTSLEDPNTGLMKTLETDTKSKITSLGTTISTKQSAVDAMQLQMQNQMAAADAMIASMQQQYTYLSSMFEAQQTADAMYK